jgi:hypothetical protein
LSEEEARRFIERAGWQEAVRPFADPHQYTLRGRRSGGVEPPPTGEHDRMIQFIEEHGYREMFAGTGYTYLDLDGFTYWASRAVFPPYHPIINRRRSDAAPGSTA